MDDGPLLPTTHGGDRSRQPLRATLREQAAGSRQQATGNRWACDVLRRPDQGPLLIEVPVLSISYENGQNWSANHAADVLYASQAILR